MRSTVTILDHIRALMACVAPVTGERARGKLYLRTTDGTVLLPATTAIVPIVGGERNNALQFQIAEGPSTARIVNGRRVDDGPEVASSWWEVTSGGVLVDIESIVGGTRHNLPAKTSFAFDPPVPGLALVAASPTGTTGGADPDFIGGCKGVAFFEQLDGADPTLDAFRSALAGTPGVVIVWDSSAPADGLTQSTLSRGGAHVASGAALMKESFNVFVIASRLDDGQLRALEGLKLMEHVTELLIDRRAVDGRVFSAPGGVQVRARTRITGQGPGYRGTHVYLVQVSVTGLVARYDERAPTPWLTSRIVTLAQGDGPEVMVTDTDVDMPQGDE